MKISDSASKCRSSRRASIPLVAAFLVMLVSCGGSSSPVVVGGDGGSTFPFETLQDWKSYGDHVAIVQITSEDKRDDPLATSGLQHPPLRYVTATVERDLWSRKEGLPKKIEFLTDGWILQDDKLVPVREKDQPRVEVGGRYLVAFIRYPVRLEQGAVASVEGDRIVPEAPDSATYQGIAGLTVDEFDAKLAGVKPDPVAAHNGDLPPAQRYDEVSKAQKQRGGPTTTND